MVRLQRNNQRGRLARENPESLNCNSRSYKRVFRSGINSNVISLNRRIEVCSGIGNRRDLSEGENRKFGWPGSLEITSCRPNDIAGLFGKRASEKRTAIATSPGSLSRPRRRPQFHGTEKSRSHMEDSGGPRQRAQSNSLIELPSRLVSHTLREHWVPGVSQVAGNTNSFRRSV